MLPISSSPLLVPLLFIIRLPHDSDPALSLSLSTYMPCAPFQFLVTLDAISTQMLPRFTSSASPQNSSPINPSAHSESPLGCLIGNWRATFPQKHFPPTQNDNFLPGVLTQPNLSAIPSEYIWNQNRVILLSALIHTHTCFLLTPGLQYQLPLLPHSSSLSAPHFAK